MAATTPLTEPADLSTRRIPAILPPYRTFLTARWCDLAMVNWEVPAELLSPYIPTGTQLDRWNGRVFISLVAFRFENTRVLHCPVPFHTHFEEVNVRFYVQRRCDGEVRRGVVFIKEIVPRALVARVARALFNEQYVAAPMWHQVERNPSGLNVRYDWTLGGRKHSLAISSEGTFRELESGSNEEFIIEHYWGYCKRRGGGTIEYQVTHPRWQVASASVVNFDCDSIAIYGSLIGNHLCSPPCSAFLATGSVVSVSFGRRITDD